MANSGLRYYKSWRPWIWYVVPAPLLLYWSRKHMGSQHVWWQEIYDGKVRYQLKYERVL